MKSKNKQNSDFPGGAKDRFPKRVIQATGGNVPDAYDGSYYQGGSAKRVVDELAGLAVMISSSAIDSGSPEGRVYELGPLPEGVGVHSDY